MDCRIPLILNVSDECGRQDVVQRSLDALGHQSLARENLEAQNHGLRGCWAHGTLETCAGRAQGRCPKVCHRQYQGLVRHLCVKLFLVDLPWWTGQV